VPQRSASSFRDLVELLVPVGLRRILDVGAGGFAGETTTVHLLDLFDAEVVGVEVHEGRAAALREKFGDALRVEACRLEAFVDDQPYDLIVLDLDTVGIPGTWTTLLPGPVKQLLAPGGFVAALLVDAGVRVVGFEAGGWRHRGDDHPDEHNAAYYCRGDMVPKYLAEAPAGAATTTSPRGRSRSASAG